MTTVMWSPSLMALIILIGMVVVLFLLVIIREYRYCSWLLRELWKTRHPEQQLHGTGDLDDPSRRHSRVPMVGVDDIMEEPSAEDKPPSYDEALQQRRDSPAYVNVQFITDSLPPS